MHVVNGVTRVFSILFIVVLVFLFKKIGIVVAFSIVFIFFFVIIIGTYLIYAARMLGRVEGWYFNLPLFFMFFAILFGFWWTVSIIYAIFDRDVGWR